MVLVYDKPSNTIGILQTKLRGGGHAALLSWTECHAPSMEEAYDDCKLKKLVLLVCKTLYKLESL